MPIYRCLYSYKHTRIYIFLYVTMQNQLLLSGRFQSLMQHCMNIKWCSTWWSFRSPEDPSNGNVFVQESAFYFHPPGGSSFSSRFWSGKEMPWWGEQSVVLMLVVGTHFFNGEVGVVLFLAEIEAEMPIISIYFNECPLLRNALQYTCIAMNIIVCTWYNQWSIPSYLYNPSCAGLEDHPLSITLGKNAEVVLQKAQKLLPRKMGLEPGWVGSWWFEPKSIPRLALQ